MSLSPLERILLERRLRHHRRRSTAVVGLLGLIIALLVLTPTIPVVAGVVGAGVAYAALADELDAGLETIESLHTRQLAQTTHIYDRNGALLREMFVEGRRTYLHLEDIPEHVRDATIAVEDKTFYTNPGVDPIGVVRALRGELTGQPGLGGGSTITQQLVRNVAFTYEERTARSYARKVKEIVLAYILTSQQSKDQILEWYLNEIYYGNLAYGIEAAAQTVFGKPATDLDLAEGALLAGLPQLPGELDPLSPDPEVRQRVRNRQRVVLNLMADNEFITREEADRAAERELVFKTATDDERFLAPHFSVWAAQRLEEMVGAERLAAGGLEVTTTLDLDFQQLAEGIAAEQVEKVRERFNLTNAALVSMEPRTGQILAMVGGLDYWAAEDEKAQVNVAVATDRGPGSSIKPLAYVTAIENGMPTSQVLWDVPTELTGVPPDYKPRNYDGAFHGPVRLRSALANSYNIPALKLLAKIRPGRPHLDAEPEDEGKGGVELFVETAQAMGLRNSGAADWPRHLGLTLGAGEATLLDMTTAYATLANEGAHVAPHPFLRIVDSNGEVLYDLADDLAENAPEQVVDERAAYIVTDILSDNDARSPAFGASSPLRLGVPAAAKTGTTNEYLDNWTLGFTPYLVTGVWAGNTNRDPMKGASGVSGAAPIWNAFMRNVVNDETRLAKIEEALAIVDEPLRTSFRRPDGIVERSVCRLNSLNAVSSTCPEWQNELFLSESAPPDGAPADGAPAAGAPDAAAPPDGAPLVGGATADDWTVVQAAVVPLPGPSPEQIAAAEAEGSELRWPPALLCLPGLDGFGADKAQPVAVLPLPPDEPGSPIITEGTSAATWAADNGWAAVPPSEYCTPEMVTAALERGVLPGGTSAVGSTGLAMAAGSEYRLNLSPGTLLSSRTTLTGTVRYNPNDVEYYKVELGMGQQPREWITLGDVHREMVVDGPIEVLDAPSLPIDDYIVRLVLVKKDGNFLDPPYSVPIRVGR